MLSPHPQHADLNNEAHARPFLPMHAPCQVSVFVLLGATLDAQQAALITLTQTLGLPAPVPDSRYYLGAHDGLTLRWSSHAEFARYTLVRAMLSEALFASTALDAIPPAALRQLPGEMIFGMHAEIRPQQHDHVPLARLAETGFAGHDLIGGEIAEGRGIALTDLKLHADPRVATGFARLLLLDRSMGPQQAGRMLQRLIEIEQYRLLALLALPVAKQLQPVLTEIDTALHGISAQLNSANCDEAALLQDVIRLATQLEDQRAATAFRFGATRAYQALIRRRLSELCEHRLPGIQPFGEFIERRLAPALASVETADQRQTLLSSQLQNSTRLIRTRVEIISETQRHALLGAMNRRAGLQLRLQETVEGLSVGVLTYYAVSLFSYGIKAVKSLGVHLNSELLTGLSIPLVAGLVAWRIRKMRQRLAQHEAQHEAHDLLEP